MADISKITLPSGTTYDIKDAQARSQIAALVGGDAVVFVGVSSTSLTDGGSQVPTVDGAQKTPATGQLFFYGTQEFIWGDDDKWHGLGSLDTLGDLAYKDTASTSYQPKGSVSTPTFTGTSSTVTITATNNANGNYQPNGAISGGVFSGSSTTFTGKFTPSGTISTSTAGTTNQTTTVSAAASGTTTYTPDGSVSQPSFTGTAGTVSGSGKFIPEGTVSLTKTNKTTTVSSTTGTATYTPDGTVGTPTISLDTAGSTTTIKNPTSVTVAKTVVAAAPGETAPSNSLTYYSVTGETLSLYQLGYTTGDSITTSNVTVKDGDATYVSSQPSWTGTGVRLVTGNISTADSATFTGTEGDVDTTASFTPAGTVSQPSFSGTAVRLVTGNIAVPSSYTSTWTGTEGDVSVSGTPNGSNSAMSFTGTKVQLSGTTTASGNISQPIFTGTEETITVD